MMLQENLLDELRRLQGKTIAIVYIYEGEDAAGFDHYHVWRSDVISGWLNAVQTLHCLPLILDVRTFVEKAINRSLPHIDFVLNLNCGSCELASMGLVPSVCGFLAIPCIPCSTSSIIAGEDKYLANLIAMARGIQTPRELEPDDTRGIYRPLNYGSSTGVVRGYCPAPYRHGTYQEFIPGFDITTPVLYNPLVDKLELMPTVAIISNAKDVEWFYGEEENKANHGIERRIIPEFKPELSEKYEDVVRAFSISTFCRIDARIKCQNTEELQKFLSTPAGLEDVYFLEINPMPSIRLSHNEFAFSFDHLDANDSFMNIINVMNQLWGKVSLNDLILACSMLAHTTTKYKK